MNSTMTERDKKLLYMLGFIIIIFLFVIVAIRPLFRSIRKHNEAIEEAQIVHDEIELKINRLPVLQSDDAELSKKVDEYAARYYPMMDSTEVDLLLTGYVLEHNLKAINLYINMSEEATPLVSYVNSEIYAKEIQNVNSKSIFDTEEEDEFAVALQNGEDLDFDEAADSVEDTTESGVYTAKVTIDTCGKKENLQKLLDDLMSDKSIRVVSFEWKEVGGSGFSYINGELTELDELDEELEIIAEVYMYDDSAYSKEE